MHVHGGSCVFTVHVFLHGHVSSHVNRCFSCSWWFMFFMVMVVYVFHGHGHGGLCFHVHGGSCVPLSCMVVHGFHGRGFMLSMDMVSCFPWS